ncbi:MAG: DUF4230 domain-containing protein [Clostridia bacterium]|nr:DUF4230 domain-containing protein [Clostridia bacterium]
MDYLKKALGRFGKGKLAIVAIAAAVIVGAIIIFVVSSSSGRSNEATVVNVATIEKIINVSELSTYTAVYNGVAEVMNEKKPDKTDYYVAYEASVDAGFDFSKIEITVYKENKLIRIKLPEIYITDVSVAFESMDFMWVNDKANTSTVSEQAYKMCIADVENESKKMTALLDLARQNAIKTIEALTKPITEQAGSEYTLVIE